MKDINYIIWGISNEGGYNESISSSFDNNILPNFIKKSNSTGDEIRRIALAYASDNPKQNYFYSLERVDDKVLYTIYRTNWYRDNRISYDAITLIINKNYILENAALSLKKVILQYVSLKDSGVRDYNISSIISSLKVNQKSSSQRRNISSNSSHAYLIKNDKKAFKKYSSESELNKIFIDQKSSLLNFNKVFFITKLNYLEEGAQKLVNLNDIRPFDIRLENFNYNYHTLYVDGVRSTDLMGNTFSAYEGDKVEVLKNPGNKLEKSIIVSQNQSAIVLEKIKIKKPKPIYGRRGKPSWKTKENIFIMSTVFIMSLAIIFMTFETEIEKYFTTTPTEEKSNNDNQNDSLNKTDIPVYKQDRVVFENSCFFISNNKITSPDSLMTFFYSNGIIIDTNTYFTDSNQIFRFSENSQDTSKLNFDDLERLHEKINNSNKDINKKLLYFIKSITDQVRKKNNQTNQNKKIVDKQENITPNKEVLTPTIKVNNQNSRSTKKKIDCSADDKINELKDRYLASSPSISLKKLIKKITDDNENKSENQIHLYFAQDFIISIDECNCNECKKIKKEHYYSDLKEKVKFYIGLQNEKK